jgi:hypothetical protein
MGIHAEANKYSPAAQTIGPIYIYKASATEPISCSITNTISTASKTTYIIGLPITDRPDF